jgi:hypothetical protein
LLILGIHAKSNNTILTTNLMQKSREQSPVPGSSFRNT